MSDHLQALNSAQRQAAEHLHGPLLIVAGAGAGKTKTVTHRIANLIAHGVPGHSILALTFTNKAAGEMKERVYKLLTGTGGGVPFVATFHTLGVRLLREFHVEARVPKHFSIWDRDDSLRATKRILKEMGDEKSAPRTIFGALSKAKGLGKTIQEYRDESSSYFRDQVVRVWEKYETTLHEEGALDFEDLLVRTRNLLRDNTHVRSLLNHRWQFITIDEYQDTNAIQYDIARLLAGEKMNLCVVGDVDQCLVEGTPVTMADQTLKNIEEIKRGDWVLSNYGQGSLRPAQVLSTRAHTTKKIVRITFQNGDHLESTPEHIHFAGYKLGLTTQTYFTYLMHKRGKGFRLGVSQVYTRGQKQAVVGFVQRCNQEHADGVWIIETHNSIQKARVAEYVLSLKYKIPTLPFVARKGGSTNGYVHDQTVLDEVFERLETESAGEALLHDAGLYKEFPHHAPRSRASSRRNMVITLCASSRGKTPMHTISIVGNDAQGKKDLLALGFSVRPAKKGSESWRFETAHASFDDVMSRVQKVLSLWPDAHIIKTARLGGKKDKPKDGNSLPFTPASSVRAGMVLFRADGGYETVQSVETIEAKRSVYDLNITPTHNFIAHGIVTHNCIYSWRNADIGNLLLFEKTFPGTKTVTLEENYRSTRTILAAANGVIEKNVRRVPKKLFTHNDTGEAIVVYGAGDETGEALFVAGEAARLVREGVRPHSIAVLYRQNFQSRALEEAFLRLRLPYHVLGTRFFERAEVKDVLSYLRAALNPTSVNDISRIISSPPRGIGKQTLEKMFAKQEASLPAAARGKIAAFRASLEKVRHACLTLPPSETVRFAIEESGLEKHWSGDDEESKERLGNMRELVNLATRYDHETPEEGIAHLLEEAALQSEQDTLKEEGGMISLMTIHASKGLEFDAVFVTGLEQGLFPNEPREEDIDRDEEEERRLFYVALTRARKHAYLTYARSRMKYGSRESAFPSEFIADIDERLVEDRTPVEVKKFSGFRGFLDDDEDIIR